MKSTFCRFRAPVKRFTNHVQQLTSPLFNAFQRTDLLAAFVGRCSERPGLQSSVRYLGGNGLNLLHGRGLVDLV